MAKTRAANVPPYTPVQPGDNSNLAQSGITQFSSIVNEIIQQASGQKNIAPITAANFVTVAENTIERTTRGMDALMGAISEVLSRTIFTMRRYEEEFRGLINYDIQWGSYVRKITEISKLDDFEDDLGYELTDGKSVDMFRIKLPLKVQFDFWGSHPIQAHRTFTDRQLATALRGPGEMAEYLAQTMTFMDNMLRFKDESLRRALVSAFIAAKKQADPGNVINLVAEYNTYTGGNYSKADLMHPDNFAAFMRWAAGFIANKSVAMRQLGALHHMNPTGMVIPRHTPQSKQKLFVANGLYTQIVMNALAVTFNDSLVKLPYTELVAYWQNQNSPEEINIKPMYLNAQGQAVEATTAVDIDSVFALLIDEDALFEGIAEVGQSVTPFNSGGRYYNVWWNKRASYCMDLTENAIVFTLEDVTTKALPPTEVVITNTTAQSIPTNVTNTVNTHTVS